MNDELSSLGIPRTDSLIIGGLARLRSHQSLRISKASGLGGAPPLQVEAGQDDTAIARSISARRVTESPARDLGGANTNCPPPTISTFMKRLKGVGSGSGSIPSSRNAEHRLSVQFAW